MRLRTQQKTNKGPRCSETALSLFRKRLYDFCVALSMTDEMRLAWIIVIGERQGGEWSWPGMRWLDRK